MKTKMFSLGLMTAGIGMAVAVLACSPANIAAEKRDAKYGLMVANAICIAANAMQPPHVVAQICGVEQAVVPAVQAGLASEALRGRMFIADGGLDAAK